MVTISNSGCTAFFTCSASTERSGSATVMSTPITKHTDTSSGNLRDLVRPEPTCSPIGVMERSAPRLKSAIPTTRNTAQMQKTTSSFNEKSASGVNESSSTISVTGSTEKNASLVFS